MLCRCLGMGLGKAKKSHLQLNLARDMEGIRESVGLLLSGTRIHVTKDMEKAEVLPCLLCLGVYWEDYPLGLQAPDACEKCKRNEDQPLDEKSQGKKCTVHSFMGCTHDW